jgi:hypothetical protein
LAVARQGAQEHGTARDPEEAFRSACAWLTALEAKHGLLKGVAEVKPVIERDEQGRLASARLVFERNAVPPDKGPAQPKDAAKPFVYVSIQVWSGRSQQPPGNMHEFPWKGQTYQMWMRVFASDTAFVQAVRKSVDEQLNAPPGLEHPKNPSLRLEGSQPWQAFRQGRPLIFEGLAPVPIHQAGPEYFKLTRMADGQVVRLRLAYDRDRVEHDLWGVRLQQAAMGTVSSISPWEAEPP